LQPSYITVDDAIHQILPICPGTFLAEVNARSAFHLIPVHPANIHLLGMEWGKKILVCPCSAQQLFNVLAELLSWSAQQFGVSFLAHYVDDFLTMGPPDSTTCGNNLQTLKVLCADLGLPLALEKVEGPLTAICFIRIILDTVRMQIRLPTAMK